MKKEILNNLHLQKLQPEHLEQFDNLLRYAFQVTDEELLRIGWEDDDIRKSKYPILEAANVLGWFDEDQLVSQIAVYPMQMNIQGNICDIGFVTGVATYPEYAGMGLMSGLMKESLTEMRYNKQSICLLYPYSIPFYRRKGWEIISDKMTYKIKDVQLPKKITAPGRVRRLEEEEESQELRELHNRFAFKTHGCLVRNELAWQEYWRWDVEDVTTAIYYSAKDKPLGYVVYLMKKDLMQIKEMVCLNQEAWKGLWVFITAHDSMVDAVRGNNYSNNSIAFWLEDSDIEETIQPYMMARIVDFEQFIAQYQFINSGQNEKISFIITDPLLEWNNRTFTLEFEKNGSHRLVEGEAKHKISLSIGTLSALLMSYKSPRYLHRIERLQADEAGLAFLETILPKEKAYISDYL